jgi:hypothetical protein
MYLTATTKGQNKVDTNELIFTTTLTVGDLVDLANYMADEETEIEVTKEQIEVLREQISDAVMRATQSFIDDNFG